MVDTPTPHDDHVVDPSRKTMLAADLITVAGTKADDAPPVAEPHSALPARLGHYIVLDELGRGGMGVVCAAYDQALDRKVAIKLLHARGGEQAQARLVREAQALARLSHPNVVQIYEIGEVDGLAFIVMEFVDGITLRDWLAERTRSPAEILAVFQAAGLGLAAAHAEGLVHRDFKPDNVMIRRDARVLVMDFGLARGDAGELPEDEAPAIAELANVELSAGGALTIERSNQLSVELTRTGSLLGTPAYMAPEQFLCRETDAKTDQFAFCVTLWEALTGARPFAGRHLAQIVLAVTTGSITTPASPLPSWIRRHLERGLALEPDRRWGSMDELLAALRDDPTRRRRLWLAAVTLAALGLASALTYGFMRERQLASARASCEAEGRAIFDDWSPADQRAIEAEFLASDLPMAEQAWTYTQRSMDAYARTWSELRTRACLDAHVEQRHAPGDYAVMAACFDEQRAAFTGLIETWRAPDQQQVGGAASAAAHLPPAATCVDELLLAAQRWPEDADTRARVTELRLRLGRVQALGLARAHEQALLDAEALLLDAEDLGYAPLIAELRYAVANAQQGLGRYEEAEATMRRALIEAGAAGDDVLAAGVAAMLVYLVGHKLARPAEGLVWAEVARMQIDRAGLGGSTREASLISNTGVILDDLGDYQAAIEHNRRALELREAKLGPNDLNVANSLNNLGAAHHVLGRHDDALALFERVLSIRQSVLGPDHPDVAAALDNIGVIHFSAGRIDDALATFERSLATWIAALGPAHIEVATSRANLGAIHLERGDVAEAIAALEIALADQRAALRPDHPMIAGTLSNLATAQHQVGDIEASLDNFSWAIEQLSAAYGAEHPRLFEHHHHYGQALMSAGRHADARAQFERAIELGDAEAVPHMIADVRFELTQALQALGEHEQALDHARRARALLDADDPRLVKLDAWLTTHE